MEDFESVGWRFIDPTLSRVPEVGQDLRASRVWEEDEPTDDVLDGTSAFRSREAAEAYAGFGSGYIVRIGGRDRGTGGDPSIPDEILVGDAKVLEVHPFGQQAGEPTAPTQPTQEPAAPKPEPFAPTTEQVQRAFQGAKVEEAPWGFRITRENKPEIRLVMVNIIQPNEEALAEHGITLEQLQQMKEDGEEFAIAGAVSEVLGEGFRGLAPGTQIVRIAKYEGDTGTIDHESFHIAFAQLSPGEKLILMKAYGDEEGAANGYQGWVPDNDPELSGPVRTIFRRIQRWARRIIESMPGAEKSAQTIFEDIQSGKVYETAQKRREKGTEVKPRFQVLEQAKKEPVDRDAFQEKFKPGTTKFQIRRKKAPSGPLIDKLSFQRPTEGKSGTKQHIRLSLAALGRAIEKGMDLAFPDERLQGAPPNSRTVLTDDKGKLAVGRITFDDWKGRSLEWLGGKDEVLAAREWYDDVRRYFEDKYGVERGRIMMTAWLYAQRKESPSGSLNNVLATVEEFHRAYESGKKFGLAHKGLKEILQGGIPVGGAGLKIFDFTDSGFRRDTRTSWGDDPRGGAPATIDRHSGRDVGFIDMPLWNALVKRFGEEALRAAGLEPDFKKDFAATPHQYEWGSRWYNALADHLNEVEWLGVSDWKPREVQAVGWLSMATIVQGGAETTAEAFEGNVRDVSMELAFGENAPYNEQFPEFKKLPFDQQAAVTKEILDKYTREIADLLGIEIKEETHGTGYWEGKVNPSLRQGIFSSKDGALLFANSLGYLLQQDGMLITQPSTATTAKAGLDIVGIPAKKLNAFWNDLNKKAPKDTYAFGPIKNGVRSISNRNGLKGLEKLAQHLLPIIDEVAKAHGIDVDVEQGTFRMEFVGNDWKESPDGGSYLEAVRSGAGEEVASRLGGDVRSRFEQDLGAAIERAGGKQPAKRASSKGSKPVAKKRQPAQRGGLSPPKFSINPAGQTRKGLKTPKLEAPEASDPVLQLGEVGSDKTSAPPPSAFAKEFRRQFKTGGNLPSRAWEAKIRRDGRINAAIRDVTYLLRDLRRDLAQTKGDRKSHLAMINEALKTVDREQGVTIDALPDEYRPTVRKIRDHLDRLSGALRQSGLVSEEMAGIIADNLGVYLHRSYQAFDDPKWSKKVDDDIKREAMTFVANEFKRNARKRAKRQVLIQTKEHIGYRSRSAMADYLRKMNPNLDANELEQLLDEQFEAQKDRVIAEAEAEFARQEAMTEKEWLAYVPQRTRDFVLSRMKRAPTYKARQGVVEPEDLRNELLDWKPGAEMSSERQEKAINQILTEGTAADSPFALLSAGGLLGAKDLSALKHRKDVPLPIRRLLGEYHDPIVNYMRTATNIIYMLENHRMLEELKADGLESGWLQRENERKPDPRLSKKIKVRPGSAMAPLNDMFVSPEVHQALEDALDRVDYTGWVRYAARINGIVKYGKTVGSLQTHIRNVIGNTSFAMANGHINLFRPIRTAKFAGKSIATVGSDLGLTDASERALLFGARHLENRIDPMATWARKLADKLKEGKEDRRKWMAEMIEYGVVHESAQAGELYDTIDEATKGANWMLFKPIGKTIKGIGEGLTGVYRAEDDVWKLFAFQNEYERYKKANPDWSDQKVKERAAHIVRNTYPTYSQVPKAIRSLRRFPLMGTFVSFPWEVLRTTGNTFAITNEEMTSDNPEVRKIGAARLVGMWSAISFVPLLGAISRLLVGISSDDEEAMRLLMPPWSANSVIFHLLSKDGKARYIDIGYSDAHGLLRSVGIGAYRGFINAPVPKKLKDDGFLFDPRRIAYGVAGGLHELTDPFVSPEILIQKVIETYSNKKEGGGKVYEEEDSGAGWDIAEHIWGAFEWGTLTSGRRVYKGARDQITERGRKYDPMLEGIAVMTGQRIIEEDTAQQIAYRAYDYEQSLRGANGIFTKRIKQGGNITEKDLREAYERTDNARRRNFIRMSASIRAARIRGMDEREILKQLRDSNISAERADALLDGEYRPYGAGRYELNKKFWDDIPDSRVEKMQGLSFDERRAVVDKLIDEAISNMQR